MRRLFLGAALSLFVAVPDAWAATVNITVPDEYVPRAQEICDDFYTLEGIHPDFQTIDLCAEQIFWVGMGVLDDQKAARDSAAEQVRDINAATQFRNENYPEPVASFRPQCGNTKVETNVGETCDPPNCAYVDPGDGSPPIAGDCLDASCTQNCKTWGEIKP